MRCSTGGGKALSDVTRDRWRRLGINVPSALFGQVSFQKQLTVTESPSQIRAIRLRYILSWLPLPMLPDLSIPVAAGLPPNAWPFCAAW